MCTTPEYMMYELCDFYWNLPFIFLLKKLLLSQVYIFSLFLSRYHNIFGYIYCRFGTEESLRLPFRNYLCSLTGLYCKIKQ